MKNATYIFALLLSSPVMLVAQENGILSTSEFQQTISGGKVQLLDVRTANEFQASHLKNALRADWNKPEEFKDRVQYLDKSKPVLVYCAAGARSHAAADWLRKNNFTDVRELKGGIAAWKGDNKPVEELKTEPQMTSEEYRQLVSSHAQVLVDFGTASCPPCRAMEPVIAQLKDELPGKFKLVTIDAIAQAEMAKQLKLEMIPTFIIYQNGREVWRTSGVTPLKTLKKKLGEG